MHIREIENLKGHLTAATRGQRFTGQAAATFLWSVIPERTEWRYAEASYKVIGLDAGHVCQNLYLACEAIGAGTCAIAAYDQAMADACSVLMVKRNFVSTSPRSGRLVTHHELECFTSVRNN